MNRWKPALNVFAITFADRIHIQHRKCDYLTPMIQ